MTLFDKCVFLNSQTRGNYYPVRVAAQIGYALRLSSFDGNKYDSQIGEVIDFLMDDVNKNGCITTPAAVEAEKRLAFLSELAKKITVYCVSHAHIDMNWMWGYQETAATTIDTFRTMLDLMDEYKDFTFSQSQASVYKIVEETDPDMLQEIKARIHEGRWEISASTWVETDKNMPNGESLARHILYTKRYLSKLFDVKPDSMQLDYEPDTFGHNWSVPEILNKGGVKYYYHCRAYEGEYLYKWQSRNGASITVFKDPSWYGGSIDYDMLSYVPEFCNRYKVDAMLKVYGVGNHGGGPTRRDVERIADMMTWPVMPTIKFGGYHEFFKHIEKFSDVLPVVNQELNFVFTGCYTSQSRIKMSNRISEDRLYEAEAVSAAAGVLGGKSHAKSYSKAWEKVLFNHFHDILPGSGVIDTREYALGQFQQTLSIAQTNMTNALRTITKRIDTSAIPVEIDRQSIAEGGGAGFAVEHGQGFKFPQAERGNGKARIFHLFNPTAFDREAPCEIAVWDWNYDQGLISVKDSSGKAVEWKHTQGTAGYWGHNYFKIVIDAKVPAFGYATYVLTEESRTAMPGFNGGERSDHFNDADIIIENDKVKAVFDRRTMQIISFVEKKSGKDVICKDNPAGVFRFIREDTRHGMTSWRVGHYMSVENLNTEYDVRLMDINLYGIRKWVSYEIKFKASSINVTIALDKNSSTLKYNLRVDWHEVGRQGDAIPQLNFYNPISMNVNKYRYDIPFATIDREEKYHDMPGNSYAVALPSCSESIPVMVVTDTKYGFRTVENSLAVDLIRSSCDPDPYPEYGIHHINIGLAIPENTGNQTLKKTRDEFVHIIPFISGTKHGGDLPLSEKIFAVNGDVIVSSVKTAEDSADGKEIIVRLYDANGNGTTASLKFAMDVSNAEVVDINENTVKSLNVYGNTVTVDVPKYEVITLKIRL